jgi:hypothetical protein
MTVSDEFEKIWQKTLEAWLSNEVHTAVNMSIVDFWVVTLCGPPST